MNSIESLNYLRGVIDGQDPEGKHKRTAVYKAIADVLEKIIEDVDDMTDGMELIAEQLDAVDEDLAEVEDFLIGDDDCDCYCDDCCDCDELEEFEVECPLCGAEITVDEETVLSGTIPCPNCGEMLEFEIDDCDCDECCECEEE